MDITAQNKGSLLKRIKARLSDPILIYTVMIMMSILYHYRDGFALQDLFFPLIFTCALFTLFDFINKHRVIGTFSYLAAWFIIFIAVDYCIGEGMRDYPIGFTLWFFTPQIAMDFNIWYTRAIFLLFMMFMSSVVYYFTVIRYRLFMSFLVFIIPFGVYGKEFEKMPTIYIILLSVGYIVVMFYCRQMKASDGVVIVNRKAIASAAGVFTIIFAVASSIVPKPKIEANRTAMEQFISAEQFTDRLVAKLSAFRNDSSGGQFRKVDRDTILYLASAEEPLRLKTATFSEYSFRNDSWHSGDEESAVVFKDEQSPVHVSDTGALTESIMLAVKLDSDFAEKYGLSEFASSDLFVPDRKKLKIYSVYQQSESAPVPNFAEELTDTSYGGGLTLTKTGVMKSEGKFARTEDFEFDYCTDTYFAAEINRRFIEAVADNDYYSLLCDAEDIIEDIYYETDEGEDEIYEKALDVVTAERKSYRDYVSEMIDYGGSQRIKKLAGEITEGLSSDFEKAKALEIYFYNNDYVYDLSYAKTSGENVENFIFNTKRGVCYEYATAMVMLSRAAGIPARYCEGYNMSTEANNSKYGTNYNITTLDAHGFPELYIKGFGWMSFEPTITNSTVNAGGDSASALLKRAGYIMLCAALLFFILFFTYPMLSHRMFIIMSRRRSASGTARRAMHSICAIYKIGSENTSDEVRAIVYETSGADISSLAKLFDKAVYGEAELPESDKSVILADYTLAYNALKEAKKAGNKKSSES